MWRDIRFVARLLAKDAPFTLMAVLGLALGIGASTTVFVVVNAALLRDLPFRQPDRLVDVATRDARGREDGMSYVDYRNLQTVRAFESLAVSSETTIDISEDARPPERLTGTYVSAGAFRLLRLQPIAGRDFLPGEEATQGRSIAILGHRVWTSRYNADPGVIGRVVRLNGVAATIVGVMPEGFRFPLSTDIWQPLAMMPGINDQPRQARTLSAFARLRDGVTIEQARAEVDGILAGVGSEDPKIRVQSRQIPLRNRYVPQEIGLLMRALLGAVLFVLLIACANVANLFLARTSARTHEFAARVALGATRWDIVRQLVIENMVVSTMATIVGFVLSVGAIRVLWVSLAATKPPFWLELRFDARVFAFGAAVAVIAGLLPVLVPAFRASRTNVNDVLKESGPGTSGAHGARWSHAFITAELALTLVLLCGAGIVTRSFLELSKIDFGIETRGLTVARVELPSGRYDTSEKRSAFYDELGASFRQSAWRGWRATR